MSFHPATHVIFDVDGLILDTETLYTEIMNAVCKPHGKQFTWEVKKKQMGRRQRDAAKVLIDELNLPITVEDYCRQVDEQTKILFPHAKLLPGAEKLVQHLHKHSIPIAIATGAHREEMRLKTLEHQDLFGLFSHAVFSTDDPDVKHGKPAPDVFLVAASRFPDSPKPRQTLVFEDAPNGVEGALAAGMQVVWVPDPNIDKSTLVDKATLTLDSLTEFQPELFGLPPYGDNVR